jgi:hypothetical protein
MFIRIVWLQGFDVYQHFDRIGSKLSARTMRAVPARVLCVHMCKGSGVSV